MNANDRSAPADRSRESANRWLVVNPESGDGGHAERVRRLGEERGFTVRETKRAGHAPEIAREAARAEADLVAAAGGDGTLNAVVSGLDDADALADTAVGVVPVGTANIFANIVGVEGVDHAFEVLTGGEERRIDLGVVEPHPDGDESPREPLTDGRPFVLSSLAGLPAEASLAASSSSKSRFGTLAFLGAAFREAVEFEGVELSVEAAVDGGTRTWEGDALVVLVGNLRGFGTPRTSADAEDGLLDAVVVEEKPAHELLTDAATGDLFDAGADHARHLHTTRLEIDTPDELLFSVDGERLSTDRLSVGVRPGGLRIRVGEAYDPRSQGTAE